MNTTELITLSLKLLDEKKAENVVTIDLTGQGAFVDYMIIASGSSSRHVNTLADFIASEFKKLNLKPNVEGLETCEWALIDLGDVIIHIFKPDVRLFYNLEKMWSPTLFQKN